MIVAAGSETSLRTLATVAGLALFWGALVGALDALILHGAAFDAWFVALRYAAAAAVLQALIGLPLALAAWLVVEIARRHIAIPAGTPRVAAQVATVALPLAMWALLCAHETYMPGMSAVSPTGLSIAGLVLAATLVAGALATAGLARLAAAAPGVRSHRVAALGWLAVLGAGAFAAAGILGEPAGAPPRPLRDVVLISIDSVRKDTWDRYMAEHASPELHRFVSESRRFHQAHTTWSHSLASHASMLTGLYPFEHGAVLQRSPERATLGSAVRPEVELLSQRLARHGAQTAAFIDNSWLGPPWGLERGFDTHVNGGHAEAIHVFTPLLLASTSLAGTYLRFADRHLLRGAHVNTWLFNDWIRRRDRSRPFFAFLHFIEMHVPHDPPPAAAAAVGGGRFAGLGGREAQRRVEAGEIPPEDMPELIEHLHDLALAMLSEIDRFLVPSLEVLRDEGLLDSALVILTSDHGDNLYEKVDSYGHAHVYDTTARVPLLLHVPGDARGSDSNALVSVVDLAPTFYAFSGVHAPGRLSGVNLLDREALAAVASRAIFVQGRHPDGGTARAIVTTDHKLIENPDGTSELYDRGRDPSERHDLSAREPELAALLARQLDAVFAAADESTAPIDVDDLPPDIVEQLRGLGYIE